jgi:hypothetical protein
MAMIVIDRNPSPRALRQFAGLFLVFFGIVGYLVLRRSESVEAAGIIWGVATCVSLVGFIRPRAIRWLYVGMAYLAFPIGWVVSHVILAAVLYLVLTPIGVIMRLLRYDPLVRRLESDRTSYWTSRRQPDKIDRYFRQF